MTIDHSPLVAPLDISRLHRAKPDFIPGNGKTTDMLVAAVHQSAFPQSAPSLSPSSGADPPDSPKQSASSAKSADSLPAIHLFFRTHAEARMAVTQLCLIAAELDYPISRRRPYSVHINHVDYVVRTTKATPRQADLQAGITFFDHSCFKRRK